jgi:hypothetical protein
MSSRKWKGAKVWQEIAAISKLLPTANFCHGHHQENLATGRDRTSKIWPPTQKLGWAQEKWKGAKVWHGNADTSLPLTQFGAKTQNFKSVKMIINYGG